MGNKPSIPKIPKVASRSEDSSLSPRSVPGSPGASMATSEQQQLSPGSGFNSLLTAPRTSIQPAENLPLRQPTPLDQKITIALKELWQKRDHQEKDNQFTRILLKFPQAAEAFNSVSSTFNTFSKEKNGFIEFGDLPRIFEHLGVNFSGDEIRQVFEESNMKETGKLDFKEFLVCLAIGFVLHRIPSLENERLSIFYAPLPPTSSNSSSDDGAPLSPNRSVLFGDGNKLRIAFQLAVDAFLWFDVDGNGTINRTEMSMKLQTSMSLHSPTKKMSSLKEIDDNKKDSVDDSSNKAIWEQRFAEMDWNHDGMINFKEFLMAFESWKAFGTVRKTFKGFDRENTGYVDVDEVPVLFRKLGSGEDSTNWSIWDRRFAEMDWNRNGTIHFNEFLIAFESWVSVDCDDDDDDDDDDDGGEESTATYNDSEMSTFAR
ncbi:hypothetical protein BBO99_00001856 [Phytophthora kernoviae]|uniref:EF-hand domain-containing protein n=1 Tax=Phytophthora kernoviae TaxID=325452 RepID=A0A3R7I0C0_9STRA|nr:hypothetical protein BBI17_001610 [Phytophthora kernoviae]RLN83753.1 hypothetical protein BBO99_00001856 [Phytophthora kernoviae]